MRLKFLGTGGSQGIPVIGSKDPVCLSTDPKDRRLRSSAMLTTDGGCKILIDCGPDFRQQMLANHEDRVDAVLLTHEHNDHVIGLDDLRPLIFLRKEAMPVFGSEKVLTEVRTRFAYAFAERKNPGVPAFRLENIAGNFTVCGQEVVPVPVVHGRDRILGFRFGNLAYVTDASYIPEESMALLQGLDTLVINCLRKTEPHPLHFILPEITEIVKILRPKKTYLTHISYSFGFHGVEERLLPQGIFLAFDGLEIEVG